MMKMMLETVFEGCVWKYCLWINHNFDFDYWYFKSGGKIEPNSAWSKCGFWFYSRTSKRWKCIKIYWKYNESLSASCLFIFLHSRLKCFHDRWLRSYPSLSFICGDGIIRSECKKSYDHLIKQTMYLIIVANKKLD